MVSRWGCWRLSFIGQIGVSHIDDGGVAYWISVSYCNDQWCVAGTPRRKRPG